MIREKPIPSTGPSASFQCSLTCIPPLVTTIGKLRDLIESQIDVLASWMRLGSSHQWSSTQFPATTDVD